MIALLIGIVLAIGMFVAIQMPVMASILENIRDYICFKDKRIEKIEKLLENK